MPKRHKKSSQKPAATRKHKTAPSPPVSAHPGHEEHSRPPIRGIAQGLVVIALLIGCKLLFENRGFPKALKGGAESLLQQLLSESAAKRAKRIAIVDVSILEPVPVSKGERGQNIVPRVPLENMVKQVAQADPVAIGVDVLIEPDDQGTLLTEDQEFLNVCNDIYKKNSTQPFPVFVGIDGYASLGPDRWLKERDFGRLGAVVAVPNAKGPLDDLEEGESVTEQLFRNVKFFIDGKETIVPSMSSALADAYKKAKPNFAPHNRELGQWLSEHFPGSVEQFTHDIEEHIDKNQFQIDFGLLGPLKKETIHLKSNDGVIPPEDIREFAGKIVLIGKTEDATDFFQVPGHGLVPGVYVHAAGVDTLLDAPLYILTDRGRIIADFVAALVPLSAVSFLQFVFWRSATHEGKEALERWVPIGMGITVLLVAYYGVDWSGIYWTDYMLVAVALFLHGPVERCMKIIFKQ